MKTLMRFSFVLAALSAATASAFAEGCSTQPVVEAIASEPAASQHHARYSKDFDFDLLFMNVASGKRLSEDQSQYEIDVLSMPLLRGTTRSESRRGSGVEETKVFSDIPVFRLFSIRMDDTDIADGRFLELPFVHAFRTRIVDGDHRASAGKLTVLTMFDRRESEVDGTRWEVLHNPLLRLVAGSESASGQRFSLVAPRAEPERDETDVALLDMYSEEDFSTTRFLTLPFVDLFRADSDGTATRIRAVDSKLFSLLRTEADSDGAQTTTFLRMPLWAHAFQGTTDGDSGMSVSILRMPLLGSVFSQRTDDDGGDMKVLFVPIY